MNGINHENRSPSSRSPSIKQSPRISSTVKNKEIQKNEKIQLNEFKTKAKRYSKNENVGKLIKKV